ncbi:MAG: glycosyltransferase [Hyphomicrobium sp.]
MLTAASLRQFVRRHPSLRAVLTPLVRIARRLTGFLRLPHDVLTCFLMWKRSSRPGVGTNASGRTVVMLVVSDLRVDPRVEREARALARAGYDVVAVWPDLRDKPPPELDWGPRVTFRTLPWDYGTFAYGFPGFLGHKMANIALEYQPLAFHAHDLSTALVGLIAARATGAHLVCDFHEWYSENVTWSVVRGAYVAHDWKVRNAYRFLERMAFKHATAVVTVCESLAREMEREFGARQGSVHVIRNIPSLNSEPTHAYRPLKDELGLAPETFVLLWQGGVGPSRMIEPIIEALPLVPKCVFVIRGPGIEFYGDGYRRLAEKLGVADRVMLLPPVPSRDVVAAAKGADAGIWTLPNLCKNFYYALPNKIFEYVAAGLPVLVAHYPEARKLVEGHAIGRCFDPYDPRSIAAAIQSLASSPNLTKQLSERTREALHDMNADAEWDKLVAIYRDLEAASAARHEPAPQETRLALRTPGR